MTPEQTLGIGGFLVCLFAGERLLGFAWLFVVFVGWIPNENLGYAFMAVISAVWFLKFKKGG